MAPSGIGPSCAHMGNRCGSVPSRARMVVRWFSARPMCTLEGVVHTAARCAPHVNGHSPAMQCAMAGGHTVCRPMADHHAPSALALCGCPQALVLAPGEGRARAHHTLPELCSAARVRATVPAPPLARATATHASVIWHGCVHLPVHGPWVCACTPFPLHALPQSPPWGLSTRLHVWHHTCSPPPPPGARGVWLGQR